LEAGKIKTVLFLLLLIPANRSNEIRAGAVKTALKKEVDLKLSS